MRRLPPLNALRVFEAAARRASFTAAADALCVTHSAVSHQIAQLERWFGCELFVRLPGGIRLSAAGQALQAIAGEAFARLEAGCAGIAAEAGVAEIVLGAPASFLANWLIPRLAGFERTHPEIRLSLQTCSSEEDLRKGKVDALIASFTEAPRQMRLTPLFAERTGPVCAPALLPGISDVRGLLGLPLLHTESKPAAWAQWAESQLVASSDFASGRRFEHLSLMIEAAAAGMGVAIAPELLVEREIALGRLVAPFGFAPSGASFSLCLPVGGIGAALAALREWLVEEGERAAIPVSERSKAGVSAADNP
ncbi:LysR substrate-binding domain-containing protein [Niveibacterium terrae]|uniref:LysR substrate-binding domain-containing protein n=1 Tax=Niveibacterium terrae TaxID=3373598 RepID=UPI003A91A7D1